MASDLPSFWDSSLDLLVIAGLDGRFRRVNRAWQTVLGYREDELVGRSYLDLLPPEDHAATIVASRTALAEHGEIRDAEVRYLARDGRIVTFLWRTKADLEEGVVYAVGREVARAAEPAEPPGHERLTAREREVLTLTASGHSRAEIAERLCVSVRTVESHRKAAARKLGARSRAELVAHALTMGLLRGQTTAA